MSFATIRSRVSAFWGEAVCRHYGVIILANRRISLSEEFSARLSCGLRNMRSSIRDGQNAQSA